ncbi:UDP-2,3-diacylglucosamine diphosphatase [Niveibacterium terrae]|uniref:UDP-2,3-diacylglucosamine diphosphatase n=1 Tax=Niveibacterium terrae TaxID=3373598 RepID=UPI003A92D989
MSSPTQIHFIADLHLSPAQPATLAAFARYIAGPARSADALYILGDLFDAWPGDDALASPAVQPIVQALASLAASGCKLSFIAGNRDFLIGEAFAKAARLTLLQEAAAIDLDGKAFVLMHGDSLCTDDVAYQKLRAMVRDPVWQAAVLAKPLAERQAMATDARQQSEESKQVKSSGIMDVNAEALAACLRDSGYADLIHGHTHRPAQHKVEVDGHACTRWVLPDWHDKAVWLEWRQGQGLSFQSL